MIIERPKQIQINTEQAQESS